MQKWKEVDNVSVEEGIDDDLRSLRVW
jgi:hypothetical protein